MLHEFPLSSFKIHYGLFRKYASLVLPIHLLSGDVCTTDSYPKSIIIVTRNSTMDWFFGVRTVHGAVDAVLPCKSEIHVDKRFLSSCCSGCPLYLGLERANAGLTATSSHLYCLSHLLDVPQETTCAALATCLLLRD